MKRAMVLTFVLAWTSIVHAETVTVASVKLPLDEYLSLVRRAEEAERAREAAAAAREPSVADIVSQRRRIVIGDEIAEVHQSYEVELRGEPLKTASLPVTGFAWRSEATPARVALSALAQGLVAAAEDPGRYTITVDSVALLSDGGGVRRLHLAADAAPVALTELELAAELGWSCAGAVVAADEVRAGRRHLRLAFTRGREHVLELRREVRGGEAERTFAKSVVVTLIGVGSAGASRHDVVLYDVARGGLDDLEVSLPRGFEPERLATDEGEQPPVAETERLVVQRSERLSGHGWLALTAPFRVTTAIELEQVEPTVPVRARYLVLAASVPANLEPETGDWVRVDIGDLPRDLADQADALDMVSAWRWSGDETGRSQMTLTTLPPAESLPTVIRDRETVTVLTVEGTLVHRDLMRVETSGSAVPVEVPAGSTLWSAKVDGLAVRPVERQGQTLIPVPFRSGEPAEVEVVLVAERAVPEGRSEIDLGLPELGHPVLAHTWRLVLPESKRYRFAHGDLQPVGAAGQIVRRSSPLAPQAPPAAPSRRVTSLGGRGTIVGTAQDNEGLALPGVTVQLSSDRLVGGPQSATTDVNGAFSFNFLPPGEYRLEASLVGFRPAVAEALRVSLDRTAEVNFDLVPETFGGEIEVVAEVPMVDTTQVNSSVVFDQGFRRKRADRPRRSRGVAAREPKAREPEVEVQAQAVHVGLDELRQGLVGGVRPLPVTIPETGKVLTLEGALPPPRVSVSLEVKKGKA